MLCSIALFYKNTFNSPAMTNRDLDLEGKIASVISQ